MKKLAILFLAMFVAGGVVMAQMPGLSVGGELGIMDDGGPRGVNVNVTDKIYSRPYVSYENTDLAPGLELFAEMGMPFWFAPNVWLGFDLDLRIGYGLNLSPVSRLSFALENWTLIPLATDSDRQPVYSPIGPLSYFDLISTKPISILEPSIKYAHGFDFGSIYGELAMPFILIDEYLDPLDIVFFNLTAGVETTMGVGGSMTIGNAIIDGADNEIFCFVNLDIHYSEGPLYAGLGIFIPTVTDGVKFYGMTLTPEVSYDVMPNFNVYGKLPIYGFLADSRVGRSLSMGLVIGVKYRF